MGVNLSSSNIEVPQKFLNIAQNCSCFLQVGDQTAS